MNLVIIQNRQAVTTSLQVAESFGKRHDHVVRDIEDILKGILKIEGNEKDLCQKPSYFNEQNVFGGVPNFGETEKVLFQKSTYINEQNKQEYPMYYMNRDGFTLLTMGFTGKKALEFKLKYIEAFNKMEAMLLEHPSVQQVPTSSIEYMKARSLLQCLKEYRDVLNDEANHAIQSHIVELLTGESLHKTLHTIESVKQKEWYTTGEIAAIAKTGVQKVASISKRYGIRTDPKYSNYVQNQKSRAFYLPIKYNEEGKHRLLSLLGSIHSVV